LIRLRAFASVGARDQRKAQVIQGNDKAKSMDSHDSKFAAKNTGAKLKFAMWLTAAFIGFEVFAGWRAHSLALLSDAGHNATDLLALVLSWVAVLLQEKAPTEQKTFGYHRAGVLAAFVNAIMLMGVALYIFYEGYERFLHPMEVRGRLVILAAFIGFVINAAISGLFLREGREDVNIRSALVHMIGDVMATLAIVVSGVIIVITGRSRVDPAMSLVIGVLILWSSWLIVRETLNILLEGLPKNMTLSDAVAAIKMVPGVRDVHDIHIWSLTSRMHAMSCHIQIADIPPSQSEQILREINALVGKKFNITHTTIQFEHLICEPEENPCSVAASTNHA
jgi:cobalt-zinc-cadmium efflux system protein